MAVVAVTIDRKSRSGSITWPESEASYHVRFLVETDDVNDSVDGLGFPQDPTTDVRVPKPGGYYENIGNDTNRSMIAKEINVSQIASMRWAYTTNTANTPSGKGRIHWEANIQHSAGPG